MSPELRQQAGSRDASDADLSSTEVVTGNEPPPDAAATASKRRLVVFALALVVLAIGGVKLGGALSDRGREATARPSASPLPAAPAATGPLSTPAPAAVLVAPLASAAASASAASRASASHKPKAAPVVPRAPDQTSEFGGRR